MKSMWMARERHGGDHQQFVDDDGGERVDDEQHAFVPVGLCDDGRTAFADFAVNQRHDLERVELGRNSV